jgi:predicted RNA-binding Zn ribbon-like protein
MMVRRKPLTDKRDGRKIPPRRPPRFELIAGNVCLDFVNTLDDRHGNDGQTQPKELLETYADFLRFDEDAGLLQSWQVDRLSERGRADPARAQQTLLWGRALREAIHDVFWAIMKQQAVPPGALARLNADVQGSAAHMSLVPVARFAVKDGTVRDGMVKGFEWKFDDFNDFNSALWPIARAAGELLTSDQLAYVRACFSKTCQWFFLDTSKNHHRRWCDMTRCGNRAKVQRFYERKKESF